MQEILARCAQNIVDLLYLVKFVIAGKGREQAQYLEHHAADAPQVHLLHNHKLQRSFLKTKLKIVN